MPKVCPWLSLILLLFPYPTIVTADTEFGSLHDIQFTFPLSDQWQIMNRNMISTKEGMDPFSSGFADLTMVYKVSDELSLRLGYRVIKPRGEDEWLTEERLLLGFRYSSDFNGLTISHRGRIEGRNFHYKKDDIRYRHKVTLEPPWYFTRFNLRPYIEDELVYSFDMNDLQVNMLAYGVSFNPTERFKIKVGHRWLIINLGNSWNHLHLLYSWMGYSY